MDFCKRIEEKNFNCIDFTKIIMAVFVVAIHAKPFQNIDNTALQMFINAVLETAVPFFFTASGFFIFYGRSEKEYPGRIKAYIIRMIKSYVIWSLIYLPIAIYGYYLDGKSFSYGLKNYIIKFVFVGEHFCSWQLWYLLCLIYSLVLVYLFIKFKVRASIAFAISAVMFVFGSAMSFMISNMIMFSGTTYDLIRLYQSVFSNGRIFTGLIYILVGMAAAKRRYVPDLKYSVGLLIVSIFLKTLVPEYIAPVFTLIAGISAFWTAAAIRMPDGRLWTKLRISSSVIYYTHMIFCFLYSLVLAGEIPKSGIDVFFVTLLCSGLLSAAVVWIKGKYNPKAFKILF